MDSPSPSDQGSLSSGSEKQYQVSLEPRISDILQEAQPPAGMAPYGGRGSQEMINSQQQQVRLQDSVLSMGARNLRRWNLGLPGGLCHKHLGYEWLYLDLVNYV